MAGGALDLLLLVDDFSAVSVSTDFLEAEEPLVTLVTLLVTRPKCLAGI